MDIEPGDDVTPEPSESSVDWPRNVTGISFRQFTKLVFDPPFLSGKAAPLPVHRARGVLQQ